MPGLSTAYSETKVALSGNNATIPSDIKYYPGTGVNIEMRKLLKCEQTLLHEEEKYYDGANNGPLLPVHWREVKSADYLMLRSAVFKDIQFSPALEDIFSDKNKNDNPTRSESNKLSPIQLPRAMKDSLQVPDEEEEARMQVEKQETKEKAIWKELLSDKTKDSVPLADSSIGSKNHLRGSPDGLKVRTAVTPTKVLPRQVKTVSTPSQTSPERGAIVSLSPKNPVNPQWEEVKQRSPIMRKNIEWQEHFDPKTNCNWYYNTVTGESTWEQPKNWVSESWEEIQRRSPVTNVDGTWQQYYDPTYNCNWYFNTKTNQSTWEKPAGWRGSDAHNGGNENRKKDNGNFVPVLNLNMEIHNDEQPQHHQTQDLEKLQTASPSLKKIEESREDRRIEEEYRRLRRVHYETKLDFNGSQWVEIFDSSREAFYYWNQLSGYVQWEKPDSFIQANDDLFIRSALKIQSSFRGAIERKKSNLKKQKQNDEYSKDSTDTENNQIKAKESDMWVRAYDSAKKVYYYYNSITGAVSYKKPTEVRVYNSPKLDLASTEKRIKVAEHETAPSSNIVEASFHMEKVPGMDSPTPKLKEHTGLDGSQLALVSPIQNINNDSGMVFNDLNAFTSDDYIGGLSPEQRKLMDDVSNLRRQLEVAERELDFARYGYSNPAPSSAFNFSNNTSISPGKMSEKRSNSLGRSEAPLGSSWALSMSPETSITERRSSPGALSSSFAMVHELCDNATHHAHALDVKFGHVLYQAEQERKAVIKIQNFYHKRYVAMNSSIKRKKNASATRIQAQWRCRSEQQQYLKKSRSAIKLQSQMRRYNTQKHQRVRETSAKKLQAFSRGNATRKRVHALRVEKIAKKDVRPA